MEYSLNTCIDAPTVITLHLVNQGINRPTFEFVINFNNDIYIYIYIYIYI